MAASRKLRTPTREEERSATPDRANSDARATGIRLMGSMPWGTHICVFYQTKADLLDTATAYFRAGIDGNEFCVWAISQPITKRDAMAALRQAIPDLEERIAERQIELLDGREWYLGDRFDLNRITRGWFEKLDDARARGFEGMRVSGDAFWIETEHWKEFTKYEEELDRSLESRRMIVLCTYSLRASRAVDVLDVVRAHQHTVARRAGQWEFLQSPELAGAMREIRRLRGALDVLSLPFPGREKLSDRERSVLAQIVRGASSKEAGRVLGIAPRTVDFHRANIMTKLGARNFADLMGKVLAPAGVGTFSQ
jgi:DNA-binding CsgD family transcriptional regulator